MNHNFIHPTENELAAASQTLHFPRRDPGTIRDRLAAASALLQSLDHQPEEPSLIFARRKDARVEVVPLGKGITVGRGNDCTISLPDCADLSRRHFSVRLESGAWMVEDLGSRNGTTVDGTETRITRRLLRDGDFIFAADLMFLFVNPVD